MAELNFNMNTFDEDFKWTMKLITSDVIPIFSEFLEIDPSLIKIGDEQEDMKECTDLKVLCIDDTRIAVRIRKHEYFEKFHNEATIRLTRTTTETEHEKILSGWGDYFFYGFASEDFSKISYWHILSLDAYRTHCKKKRITFKIKPNKDDSSDFYVVPLDAIKNFKLYKSL